MLISEKTIKSIYFILFYFILFYFIYLFIHLFYFIYLFIFFFLRQKKRIRLLVRKNNG